ncbi:MAG: ribonuclease Z [Bacteroidota bacterium]
MKITILGNNSALPAHNRYPTCQIVNIDECFIMIDCGEAAQVLLKKYGISWNKIRHIFISHLHGDHYFGLPGLLNSMSLLGRTESLYLYAPAPLQQMIQQILDVANTVLSYPLHFVPLPEGAAILADNAVFSLQCFPVEHRIFCQGLLVTEKSKGRKLLAERCRYYEIPAAYYKQLKAGADYERKDGLIVKNDWVTEPGKQDKKYAYCADTLYTESFLQYIMNVDLLYHESTYLEIDKDRAANRFHSTAQQAAQLAVKAGAHQLLLGHYSSKYKSTEEFEVEARTIFLQSFASKEGDVFDL